MILLMMKPLLMEKCVVLYGLSGLSLLSGFTLMIRKLYIADALNVEHVKTFLIINTLLDGLLTAFANESSVDENFFASVVPC